MSVRKNCVRSTFKNGLWMVRAVGAWLFVAMNPTATAANLPSETRPALLVNDFINALSHYGQPETSYIPTPGERFWLTALQDHQIDPHFVAARLQLATTRSGLNKLINRPISHDRFASYRLVEIEASPTTPDEPESLTPPLALHAFRLDVIEDYDDVSNDDIYAYYIVTHDDRLWGKVTSVYRDLDEGASVLFTAPDRGIFGPHGEKLVPKNRLLIDFGLIESDGADIESLRRLASAIVDLAPVALAIYNPEAAVLANQARAETKNLLRLIVELDDDDRLVTDTLRLTPESMMAQFADQPTVEFSREFERETSFTHFNYRLNFRLMQ